MFTAIMAVKLLLIDYYDVFCHSIVSDYGLHYAGFINHD